MLTGRKASRSAPVPGPTVEQAAREAMADPGTQEASTAGALDNILTHNILCVKQKKETGL